MAFKSFGDQNVQVDTDEPEEIETEHFELLALKGDSKLKLFSQPFPKDNLPVPSAQLLAVANKKGVFAAVGPQSFIFGTTQSIRDAFRDGEGDLINYNAEKTFPVPSKISHVAFDAAEEHLIVGAEAGGVAIYSLNDVISSGSQPVAVAELSLGGELREVRPNPAVESSKYVAICTANGDLRMLDLETKGFVNNGILATNISTICWSQRGKQIICGKFDGTCVQLTPSGEEKATIPCVPGLENVFVSSIFWIDNDLFSLVHTPKPSDPNTPTTESVFHMYTRPKSVPNPVFQKMSDPTPPFGMIRQSYHYGLRLFSWEPALRDMFIYCSTSSSDIGLMLRMTIDVGEAPANSIRVSTIENDSRRAEVPMDENYQSTTTVGITLDLSSNDPIPRPIAGSELDSCGSQPILMLMNNEGVLCAWHIIYVDAVKEGKVYPGMAIASSTQAAPAAPAAKPVSGFGAFAASTSASPFAQAAAGGSAFGTKPAFGQSSFGQPAQPAFGQSSFGSASTPTQPAFGQSSLGTPSTPQKPAFGAPAFGQSGFGSAAATPAKPAFGQSSFGQTPAKPAFGQTSFGAAPAFGQSSFGQPSTPAKPFGAPTDSSSTTSAFGGGSGFSKFASGSTSGFGALTANAPEKPVWAQGGANAASPFGGPTAGSAFGAATGSTASPFGAAKADGFKITSSFAADNKASDDSKSKDTGSFGGLGDAFGGALSSVSSKPAGLKDDDMDDSKSAATSPGSDMALSTPAAKTDSTANPFSRTGFGSSTSGPSPFASVGKASTGASPFGASPFAASTGDAPKPAFGSSAFGQPSQTGKSPFASATKSAFGSPSASSTSVFGAPSGQKAESPFSSKTAPAFGSPTPASAFGDTSKETTNAFASLNKGSLFGKKQDDAPLPPNPFASMKKAEAPPVDVPLSEDMPLPPDPSTTKKPPKSSLEAPLPPDTSSRETFEAGNSSGSADSSPEKAPPKTPKKTAAKKDTSSPATSSIFGSKATYQDTLKAPVNNPFAGLTDESRDEDDHEDEVDEEEDYEPRVSRGSKLGRGAKPRQSLSSTPNRMGKASPMKGSRSSLNKKPTFSSPLRKQLPESDEEENEEDEEGEEYYEHRENEDQEGYESEQFEDEDTFQGYPDEQATEDEEEPEEEEEEEEEEPEIIYQDDVDRDRLELEPIEPIYEPPELVLDVGQAAVPQNANMQVIMDKIYERTNILLNKVGNTSKTMSAYIAGASSPSLSPPATLPSLDEIETFEPWSMSDLPTFTRILNTHLSVPLQQSLISPADTVKLDEDLEYLSNSLIKTHQKVSPLPDLVDPVTGRTNDDLNAHAPLPADTQLLRRNVRTKLNEATALLDKASRELSQLQAALVASSKGKTTRRPPTVEAVRNTIRKLTNIILEKRAIVDALERELVRLRITGEARNAGSSNFRVSRRGVNKESSVVALASELSDVSLGDSFIGDRTIGGLKMSLIREEVEEKVGEWRGWGVRRRDRGKLLARACEGRGVGVRVVDV